MSANDRQVGGIHYASTIQHWDYVLANDLPYLEAMTIKYLTRWRKKDGHADLQKARHFLQKLFETEGLEWEVDAEPTAAYVGQDRAEKTGNGRSVSAGKGKRG